MKALVASIVFWTLTALMWTALAGSVALLGMTLWYAVPILYPKLSTIPWHAIGVAILPWAAIVVGGLGLIAIGRLYEWADRNRRG